MTKRLALLTLLGLLGLLACHHDHHHGAAPPIEAASTAPLTEAGIAIPIAPGKTGAWQAALDELLGPRYAEYEASRKRYGLTSQTTFLQRTPMGDFALIHMTGDDVRASFHAMSTSQDPWDVKWRAMTLDLHGLDFANGERVTPNVVPLFAMEGSGGKPFMFLAPLGEGGAARVRELAAEILTTRHADYVRARNAIGIHREAVFLESTGQGDAVVVYWLVDDPIASIKQLSASTNPFDRWLRGELEHVHPISLDMIATIASSNSLIASYPH